MNYSHVRVAGIPTRTRPTSLPALTKSQEKALDAVQTFAKKRAIELQLQAGDLVFFNNLAMLHARDAFMDDEAVGHRRHLMRLIIRNDVAAYDLPSALEETWKALYDHNVEEELFPIRKEMFTYATSH